MTETNEPESSMTGPKQTVMPTDTIKATGDRTTTRMEQAPMDITLLA